MVEIPELRIPEAVVNQNSERWRCIPCDFTANAVGVRLDYDWILGLWRLGLTAIIPGRK